MIKLSSFAGCISPRILNKRISEIIEETGDRDLDFSEVDLMSGSHRGIAEFIIKYQVKPVGLGAEDLDKIKSFLIELSQPKFDSVDEFFEAFKKRYRAGKVYILDSTNSKRATADNSKHLILIEEYLDNRVRVRKYHSSKLTTEIFNREGGKDSSSLYLVTEFNREDLFNGEVIIRHPQDETEKEVIAGLFG